MRPLANYTEYSFWNFFANIQTRVTAISAEVPQLHPGLQPRPLLVHATVAVSTMDPHTFSPLSSLAAFLLNAYIIAATTLSQVFDIENCTLVAYNIQRANSKGQPSSESVAAWSGVSKLRHSTIRLSEWLRH